jgi:hypothetical protein
MMSGAHSGDANIAKEVGPALRISGTSIMRPWKKCIVVSTMALLSLLFLIFLVTGYTALYWAWLRADLRTALTYLPWARTCGMLAMATAAAALGILFLPDTFPLSQRIRLSLSLLTTATIGFFAEFRNEGKFYLKNAVHFFGPGTWIHDGLNHVVSSLGDSMYRIEYSHWNDFLMGPAIVSVLFPLVFVKIYGAVQSQAPITLTASTSDQSTDLDYILRFARTLMNVGLFWFFIDAWAEKAGYLTNPHSNDEIDLPFEFAGTVVGFWMVRALTRPFGKPPEKFRSTLLIDFLSSGVMGLLYSLVVGPLTEGVASVTGHSLYPVVPGSLDIREYTPFQQHLRPFELLLLAGVMQWSLIQASGRKEIMRLNGTYRGSEADTKWEPLMILTMGLGAVSGYLLIVVTLLSLMEPQGLGWTLATAGMGLGLGTMMFLLTKRIGQRHFATVFVNDDDASRAHDRKR